MGSGDAPYRELFTDHKYLTIDMEGTPYQPEQPPDFLGPAHDLPLDDGSLDAVLCTQVLEHVPNPAEVMLEFFRVLDPAARCG